MSQHIQSSNKCLEVCWPYCTTSPSTHLQASLGRSRQLLGPVLAEPPSLSQLLLQLLLPSFQCWIGAARKEPVILNQFCATGKRGMSVGLGMYLWMGGGYKMSSTEWWWSERRQDDRDGEEMHVLADVVFWWRGRWGTFNTTDELCNIENSFIQKWKQQQRQTVREIWRQRG